MKTQTCSALLEGIEDETLEDTQTIHRKLEQYIKEKTALTPGTEIVGDIKYTSTAQWHTNKPLHRASCKVTMTEEAHEKYRAENPVIIDND